MKTWWLIHDPSQGHSAQIENFAAALRTAMKVEVSVMWVTDLTTIEDPVEPEGILLWCALRWYVRNRASIPGRPWVGALSWCFDDLMSIIADKAVPGINLIDAGINALWTNCPAYVQQTSAAYQCTFNHKPLSSIPVFAAKRHKFAAILPNVRDRDFSQLLWTLRRLKKLMPLRFNDGDCGPKICLSKGAQERLPDQVVDLLGEDNIIRVAHGEILESVYDMYEYVINVPRITDIRGGVVPPEIYLAIQHGCIPLVIHHPVWEGQLNGLHTFKSLTEYGEMLDRVANDDSGPVPLSTEPGSIAGNPPVTHSAVAWQVADTYKESVNARAK